jgi:hypothetical protein
MINDVLDFINSPGSTGVLKIIIAIVAGMLLRFVVIIYNRIRLAEYKHVATIYAMNKQFQNGFMDYYKGKLDELIEEDKFIRRGK